MSYILRTYVHNICIIFYVVLKCTGFEQLVKDNNDLVIDNESKCSLNYNKNETHTFLKSCEHRKDRPILKELDISPCTIILRYLDLIDNLTELLQFKDLLKALNNLMASETHQIKLFSTDFLECLKKCGTTVMVLRGLFPYSNWYDHSILRRLLETCYCPKGNKLLDEFDAQIDFTLPLKDYPLPIYQSSYMTPEISSTHTVLVVTCKQLLHSLPLQYIKAVKLAILQVFNITDHACTLLTATKTILFWLIPKSIVSFIHSKVEEHSAYLYDNKILEVAVYPDFTTSTGNINRNSLSKIISGIVATLKHVRMYVKIC